MTTRTNTARFKSSLPLVFTIICGICSGIVAGLFFAFTHDLPQITSLESFQPSSVSRVYAADNVLLTEFYSEKRDPVSIKAMPPDLLAAIVATEDRNFRNHSGVDLKGILRAIVKDVIAGEFVEGASTITQQLAKTLFLTPKKTLIRKVREAVLSFQLERRYTKDEILQFYLNQVYFGSGAYGVESAARKFFGKPVGELRLSECALLAAMPRSPSRYSPLVNPDLALKRRNLVLKLLHRDSHISEETLKSATDEPLMLAERTGRISRAPYFSEFVKKKLESIVGSERLYTSGLTIHTTLSSKLQEAAEASIEKQMAKLDARMARAKIKAPHPQCGVISLDVETGAILAMSGGRDYRKSPFNRAVTARRQPGSSFKPFVYALAVEKGYPQNKLVLDAPITFPSPGKKKPWQPMNFSKTYSGEMTLRKALALSKNIPAVRLIEALSPTAVSHFTHGLGITSPLHSNLSLALGTSETTLMELTSAYAVFANKGRKVKPYAIEKIEDRNGRVIYSATPSKEAVMSREGAAIVTNMLEAVVMEGTGKKARFLDRPLAGKTGTTDNYKDALFVGFSPSVATGVWVGNDNHTTLGRWETGAKAALPIWIDIMKESLNGKPLKYFDIPDGVIQSRIDPVTGKVVRGNPEKSVPALFKKPNDSQQPTG